MSEDTGVTPSLCSVVFYLTMIKNLIVDTKRLKIKSDEVTTVLEAQYWLEKLWEISYEDIEVWDKESYTRLILQSLVENIQY